MDKIIYLDSDIVVNLDIKEFWKVKLGDAPLAVIPEMQSYVPTNPLHYLCRKNLVKAEDFFNAGILLMNLKRLRNEEENLKRGFKFNEEHPDCDGNDQSILNYCFSTETVKLPLKFNVLVEYARMNNDFETTDRICHYITSSRGHGFGLDTNDPFNRLWLKYFMKTPWFDEDSIGRLYKGFTQNYCNLLADTKNVMVNLSAVMSGKARAFFLLSEDVDALKKKFFIRDDEEIILADDSNAIPNLVYAMGKSQGKKIFFILVPNFLAVSEILKELDFVQNRDFLNGLEFLLSENELVFNPYTLIKYM